MRWTKAQDLQRLQDLKGIHPLSLIILFGFIFLLTVLQTYKREKLYALTEKLKVLRQHKETKMKWDIKKIELQKPHYIQKAAERMTLQRASFNQVIVMSPEKTAKPWNEVSSKSLDTKRTLSEKGSL
jgi:hypothetical protein